MVIEWTCGFFPQCMFEDGKKQKQNIFPLDFASFGKSISYFLSWFLVNWVSGECSNTMLGIFFQNIWKKCLRLE